MRRNRHGISLIESLIVLAIILLVMGFLFGAIQNARHAAQLTECRNNLKQLGLAVNTFASINQEKLPKFMYSSYIANRDQFTGTVFFALLPYLEQQPLYNAGISEPNVYDDRPAPLSWKGRTTVGKESIMVGETVVKIYLCPSDTTLSATDFKVIGQSGPKPGAISYAANFMLLGEKFTLSQSVDHPYHSDEPAYTMTQIPDGVSQTILFTEKIASTNSAVLTWPNMKVSGTPQPAQGAFPIEYTSTVDCPLCQFCIGGANCAKYDCTGFPFPLTQAPCTPTPVGSPLDVPYWVKPNTECILSIDCQPPLPPMPIGGWGCQAEYPGWRFNNVGALLTGKSTTPLPAFGVCNPGVKYENRFANQAGNLGQLVDAATDEIAKTKLTPKIVLQPKDVKGSLWGDVFFRVVALYPWRSPLTEARWEVSFEGSSWVPFSPKTGFPTVRTFYEGDMILAFKLTPDLMKGAQIRAVFKNENGPPVKSKPAKINPPMLSPRDPEAFGLGDPDNFAVFNFNGPNGSTSYSSVRSYTGWGMDQPLIFSEEYIHADLKHPPYPPVRDLMPPQYIEPYNAPLFDPLRAGSLHRGPCNIVNVDGSVHGIMEGIDPNVWIHLCRPDDGEAILDLDW